MMGIPHDDMDFDVLTAHIDYDLDWDPEDPFEKGYLQAGLKRYKVDKKDSLQRVTDKDIQADKFSSSTEQKEKTSQFALKDVAHQEIKLEVKEYALLLVEKKVTASALKVLGKLVDELKVVRSAVSLKHTEAAKEQKERLANSITCGSQFQDSLMDLIAMVEACDQGSEKDIKILIENSKKANEQADDHCDAIKTVLKKAKNFLDS